MPGQFSGNPKTEWLTEVGADRNMKLLEDFWFDDLTGRRWLAPIGSLINGASIPEALWSAVGSPFTGDYRRASIVHDVACNSPDVKREDADDMFYWACISGGCQKPQAKLLYLGVRVGTWSSSLKVSTMDAAITPRLSNEYTRSELVIRAKYTLIADKIADVDDFQSLKLLVDAEL